MMPTAAAASETSSPESGVFCAVPTAAEVTTYLPLVQQVVARFIGKLPPNVLRDDLVAAGTYGLIDSLRKNGHDRSPTFEWYARIRIRGAILDELRTQDWLTRRARSRVTAAAKGGAQMASERSTVVGFDDLPPAMSQLIDTSTPNPLEASIERSERRQLDLAVESLPERERMIVRMHYYKGEQFKVIAEELGVSEPRVSQLHARAVTLLRRAMTDSAERSRTQAA